NAVEIPTVIDESLSLTAGANRVDLDKHHRVGASRIGIANSTHKGDSGITKCWCICVLIPNIPGKTLFHRHLGCTCKMLGKFALLAGENIDCYHTVVFKNVVGRAALVDADETRWRGIGYRAHSGNGNTEFAVGSFGCDDVDGCSKVSHCLTELGLFLSNFSHG